MSLLQSSPAHSSSSASAPGSAAVAVAVFPPLPALGGTLGGGRLEELHTKKSQIAESLKSLERQIFDLEEIYIRDTSQYGNLVKGWDAMAMVRLSKPHPLQQLKRVKISSADRIFSRSSITAPKDEINYMEDELPLA